MSKDPHFRAGHYKDLTETGKRVRKLSGTQGSYIQNMNISEPFIKRCRVPEYSGIFNGIIDLCMTGLTLKDQKLTTEVIVIREHLAAKDNYYREVPLTIQRNTLYTHFIIIMNKLHLHKVHFRR